MEKGRGRGRLCRASFLVSELIGQPVQSFIETVSTSGTGGLDVPVPVAKRMQAEFVCDFRCIHRIRQVLKQKQLALDKLQLPMGVKNCCLLPTQC